MKLSDSFLVTAAGNNHINLAIRHWNYHFETEAWDVISKKIPFEAQITESYCYWKSVISVMSEVVRQGGKE